MRNRLILAGLGFLFLAAAVLVFTLARLEPPPPAASTLLDDHDHDLELLPPAPVGRTLFGGNSGELRRPPAAAAPATPLPRARTPVAGPSLEVFAPARFQATPVVAASPAATSPYTSTVTTTVSRGSTVQTSG